jgi:hypothetical protein
MLAVGTPGQVLQTNGAGAPTWVTSSASQWTTSASDIYYSTGNVGIGTSTAPTARLTATGTTTGYGSALINIRAMQNDGVTLGTPIVLAGHRYIGQQDNNSGLIDVPSATGRMSMCLNGNVMFSYTSTQVGIGVANTTGGYGDNVTRATIYAYSGNSLEINDPASATSTSIYFRSGGGNRGTITTTAGGTAYNTTSDYRLKENIVDLPNALSTLAQLKPRQFSWKETGNTTTGFIAHELAEVCPHAVSGTKDAVDENGQIKPQGIDTSFLVATLTAAIQEQQALITTLTERITALEGA